MLYKLYLVIRNIFLVLKVKKVLDATEKRTLIALGLMVFLLVSIGGLAWMSFDIVRPGERGVYVFLGKSDEEALPEGFHWKVPLMAKIVKINVRQVVFDQKAEASSKDLQTVYTGIAVNYFPTPDVVWKLFLDVGHANATWENVLLRPAIQEITKAITARFTAEELITKRAEAKRQITKEIIGRLVRENINVSEVSITDFKFNKPFNDAIEAKQIAEQRAKQAENELIQVEVDAKQLIVKANAERQATIHIAEGKAREIELLTEAEAKFHATLAKVLTPSSLQLRFIERWNGILPKVSAGNEPFEVTLPQSLLESTPPVPKTQPVLSEKK